ncbi:hypothetical protein EPUS_09249 [Endocarpon pusillum Z07020]|uniref:Myb-like domain-containing protein n=1 Tax=Endocarpon pusillum (strain Z07020 / HMAS-L-300199) TaxID=1263415 RepID=U1HU85_ENDPU|nr:uncharacterized protein EPUS_09249 [Endocarpon pusillum Z07020]ERF74165.1 hypothetical protein EPUS_09249 [Endocarpon pusillum Z07020]
MSSTSRIRRWWTEEEDQILRREADFQLSRGSLNDWNRIAAKLPGRTNKDCRKRWSKIPGHINKVGHTLPRAWGHVMQTVSTSPPAWEGRELALTIDVECAKRWHHSLDPSLDHSEWVPEDDARLLAAVASCGRVWKTIGKKEFPGRSATELKNRYVIIDRKRQQSDDPSAPRTASKDSTGSATAHAEVDMEDSESKNSLSEDDVAEVPDLDFYSDILSHMASSRTTPGSNLTSHTTSSLTTPGSYVPSHSVSPHVISQDFSFTENEFAAGLPTPQNSNEYFSGTPGAFFSQNDTSLSLDNPTLDLGTLWNTTYFPLPTQQKGDDAMTGVEVGKENLRNKLILEDVQPQMVTSIIKMLFESKSVVKMKIPTARVPRAVVDTPSALPSERMAGPGRGNAPSITDSKEEDSKEEDIKKKASKKEAIKEEANKKEASKKEANKKEDSKEESREKEASKEEDNKEENSEKEDN